MKARWLSTALFCVIAGSIGCHRAENPAEVRHDVSEAQQDANKQMADARRDAGSEMNDAADKVADANREVAMARIDGQLKVAKERCEALSGDEQKACKDAADAEYADAKRRIDNTFKN
jgi:hypothetical protein